MYYDDVDYAAKRLNLSLVRRTNGNPFFVSSTLRDGKKIVCLGQDLVSQREEIVYLEDIDLTPVPLGFFNMGGKMSFACRKPMRKDWKQGLSLNSLVLYGVDKRNFSFSYLTETIMGTYPTYQQSVSYVNKTKNRSMAFSRDFGISNKEEEGSKLIYRKYVVGEIKNGVAVLSPDKYFLEQHLASAMKI
jgi:hypothetical protein